MSKKDELHISGEVKKLLRNSWLKQVNNMSILPIFEMELFEFYVKEQEKMLIDMLLDEEEFIHEQIENGVEDINDSGMVSVGYFLKRIRYSHVIYMVSLLENFLEESCVRLTQALGEGNLPFTIKDLKGDQWSVRQKFIERYGKFSIPKEIWSHIQVLIFLRNTLVHDNGKTNDIRDDEKNRLSKYEGLKIEDDELVIEPSYIYGAFNKLKLLVQFIEKEIGVVIDRAIRPRPVA